MDVEAWLRGLGLERYVQAFRDNEIDWEVLPKLTSEDLREVGVAAIGHRRKLLEAIAALDSSALTPAVMVPVSGASTPAEAERRQLTVMFCDLVGSTLLVDTLRPRGLARDRQRLSPVRSRNGRPVCGFCRQVDGRRGARLFRLSGGA